MNSVEKMEPEAKRCRIITVKVAKRKRKIELVTLNMDCTDAILKWLPIKDLYSVSCTCKSLQKSASLRFQRSYPNSVVTIEMMGDQQIQTQYEGKFDLHFSANIRNVTLTSYIFDHNPIPLFKHLKVNCCHYLKELNLLRLKCAEGIDYGFLIKGQLRNLESIAFNGCVLTDMHKQFLKYCPNLNHLRISDKKFNAEASDTWMRTVYKRLKNVTFWGCDNGDYTNLHYFFKINRTIKNVNCMGADVLEMVLENTIDLENLVIHCRRPEDFGTIYIILMRHGESGAFKRFELVFHFTSEIEKVPENVEYLNDLGHTLDAFQGFHGLFTTDKFLVDSVLSSLINLRSLSLKLTLDQQTNAWFLAQSLTRLEDVRIYITYSLQEFGATFKPLTIPFLLMSKNVKQVIVSFAANACVTHRNDIIDLNTMRSKLKGACPTTIYLGDDVLSESKFIIPIGGLVQVKPITELARNLYLNPFLF